MNYQTTKFEHYQTNLRPPTENSKFKVQKSPPPLLKDLNEISVLGEIERRYQSAVQDMTTHSYDYLDQREPYFNHHVKEFEARLSDMKLCIGTWIERNYDPVWETPQGMTFLHKFEKIGSLVPLIPLDNKHLRILSYLSDDFDRIWRILELNGSCPPVPKNFSLAAGECRHFH